MNRDFDRYETLVSTDIFPEISRFLIVESGSEKGIRRTYLEYPNPRFLMEEKTLIKEREGVLV